MRKLLKILHTLAACGLIGGVLVYMILLVKAEQGTAVTYAELRWSIAAISNYVLLPSLGVVLVSGVWSMAVHPPFLDKGWALIKAGLGIFMFKAVLTLIGAKANQAAAVSEQIAKGEAATEALEVALTYEWSTLIFVLVLSVVNVVLGVWRPHLKQRSRSRVQRPAGTPQRMNGVAIQSERVRQVS